MFPKNCVTHEYLSDRPFAECVCDVREMYFLQKMFAKPFITIFESVICDELWRYHRCKLRKVLLIDGECVSQIGFYLFSAFADKMKFFLSFSYFSHNTLRGNYRRSGFFSIQFSKTGILRTKVSKSGWRRNRVTPRSWTKRTI